MTMLSLLEPYALSDFNQEHWERSTLAIHRERPDHFKGVLPLEELDRLVCSTRIPLTNFNLAKGDDPLPTAAYATGDYVDQRRALALHRQGATIILRSIDQWCPSLAALRARAEEALGFTAQVNVYLTPPGEKSTPPHWDTHELFILQIHGNKRWRLFDSNRTLPLEDERFDIGQDWVGPLRQDLVLQTGDTLYLPRGTIHEPVAESYSVHVSLGIRTWRWYDACVQMLRLLANREGSALRATVPPLSQHGKGGDAPAGLPKELQAALALAFAEPALRQRAEEALHQQSQARRAVDARGLLLEAIHRPAVASGVHYARRRGVRVDVEQVDGAIALGTGLETARFPGRMQRAVIQALGGGSFGVDDLAAGSSTSAEDCRLVCMTLQELGVLHAVDAVDSR